MNKNNSPDFRLLKSIQRGDEESKSRAFAKLMNDLNPLVFRIIRHVGGYAFDTYDLDEVAQQTWLTVFKKIDGFEYEGVSLSHWVASIARYNAVAYRRKVYQREDCLSLDNFFEETQNSVKRDAEKILIDRESDQEIRYRLSEKIAELPPRQRLVLEGQVAGKCNRVLAAELQTTLSNVHKLASLGRQVIRASFPVEDYVRFSG